MRYRHSVISEITARRRNHTMRIARKIRILEKYKNTKIQGYEYAKDTENTRTADIAPSRFSPRRAVSWGGGLRFVCVRWAFVAIVCIG